jgi:hypothetical protein
VAVFGFTTTYNDAGTAKVPLSRTRHRILWVGLWVGKFDLQLAETNPHIPSGDDSGEREWRSQECLFLAARRVSVTAAR